ncbi:VCBS domain-containing protein [Endozoicomonas sp. ALB032]|uniref:VCBS domain-containing protein n=1 Tax=Endozoicomonas sp. ALB032 TaxID=3403082 RepID=UPI003BB65C67
MPPSSDGSMPVIGHVQKTDGDVFAIAPDGSKRILQEGDPLYLNDRVVSESSSPVSILLVSSEVIELKGQSQLVMMQDMLLPASSDTDGSSEAEEILDAIAERADSAAIAPIKVNPVEVSEPSSSEEPNSSSQDPSQEASDGLSGEVVVLERDVTELEQQREIEPLSESSEEIKQPLESIQPLFVPEKINEELASSSPVNYAPTAQNMIMNNGESATELEGKLQAFDANTGEALKFSLVTTPDSGQLILNDDGSFRFLPGSDFDYLAAGEQTVVTFIFEAIDSSGASSRASVDITITGDNNESIKDTSETAKPVLAEIVQSDDETTIDLLSQAFDKDPSDTLSVTQLRLTEGNEAGVSIGLDGNSLSIDPEAYKYLAAGETETLTYEYLVTNSRGESVLESVTITLSGDNDQPQVREAVIQTFDKNSDDFNVDLLAGAFDLDSSDNLNAVSLRITAGDPSGITIADDGNSLDVDASAYEHLAGGESEVIEYSYEIEDGQGGVVSQSASITVEGTNDNPEDIELSGTRIDENQDGAVVGTLSTRDKDLSDSHTYTIDDHRFEVVDGDLKLKEGIALDHETDDSVDVKVTTTDVDGAAYSENFTLEVNDINEAPVATDSSTTIDEDSLYRFTLNDFPYTDQDDGDTLKAIVIETIPASGSLELNGSLVSEGDAISQADISAGLLTFLPVANQSADNYTRFNFRVNDGALSSDIQTFTITVNPVDDAPVAGNLDLGSTPEDTSFVITAADLLASASDIDGDSLSIQSVTLADPATGSLANNHDGTWSYTPTAHYFGDDVTFNFTVSDGTSGDEASASATLDVISVNDAAVVAGVDTGSVTEDDNATLTTSGNLTVTDVDANEAVFQAEILSGSHGQLSINADGSWTYSADNSQSTIQTLGDGDSLTDSFTVQTADGTQHIVTATIHGTNDAPVVTAGGTLAYTENDNHQVIDSHITLTDIDSATIESATITIISNFSSAEDNLAFTDHNGVSGSWDSSTGTMTLSGTATVAQYQAALRTVTYSNSSDSPSTADRIVSFSINDGHNSSHIATSTITIKAVNDAPVTAGTLVTSDEDTPYIFSTSDFAFSDPDAGQTLQSIKITQLPLAGELLFNESAVTAGTEVTRNELLAGRLKFEPTQNEHGNLYASFEFQVSDGNLFSPSATFDFSITSVNDDPTLSSAIAKNFVEDSASVNIDLLESAADADAGDNLSVTQITLSSGDDSGITINGNTLTVDPGTYDYLPDGVTETIVYSYDIEDGNGGSVSQTATLVITGTNDSAQITGLDTATITEDSHASTLTTSGSLTITDADQGEAQFQAETLTGTYGDLVIDASGQWTYTADNTLLEIQRLGDGDTLSETFTVTAAGGDNHNVAISIDGSNDAPTISSVNDVAGAVTEIVDGGAGENSNTLTDTGSFTIADVDLSDQQSVSVSAAANGYLGSLTAMVADDTQGDGNGRIDWSFSVNDADIDYLGDGEILTQTYTVTVNDGEGGTVDQQVTITLTGSNDAPTISSVTDVAGAVTEIVDGGAGENSNTLTDNGSFTIADVDLSDQQSVSVSAAANGYLGSLTAMVADDTQADGTGRIDWSFSVNDADIDYLGDGEILTQTYSVTVDDGEGSTVAQQVTITLTGTNDVAVITGDDSGSVTEDAGNTLMTSGTLSIADVDGGEASFTPETITGTYGSLTIDGSGSWSYSASNNHADIQVLGNGDTLTETLTIRTLDGTTRNIVITINGTNDVAVITGDDSGSVTEDVGNTLMTSGTLNITDVDGGEASFTPETITGTYGSLTIDGSGTWSYSASNNHADIQALGNGDTLTETLTVRTLDGTTRNIVITINGTNDVAVITGDDSGSVTEDAGNTLMTSGTLSIADVDGGEASFTPETITGTYGSLTIDGSGSWSYSASNNHADIQVLGNGDTLTETLTVRTLDGTTRNIVITINGTNDAAVITGDDSGSVTEDAGNTLMTSGTLSIADVDGGEASFTPETITGTYGSLTIDGSGSWSYSASNNHADIQVLGNGDTLTETLTVRTLDGTTRNIVITINGTNDAAVITGDDSGSVTEDAGNTLMTSGTLSIADVDGGEASFTPETITGTYGSLTIDGSGSWSYSASNNHADIQALGNGDTLTETLTVRTLDGTTRNIVITINGTNDVAVITGDDSGSVTEDAGNTLMTSGTLSIADVDGGEASFTPETITGTYGSLTIDGSGSWSYSASNNHADIQALGNGDTLTETLTVRTLDGTTRNIVITINGTNDAAVITGDDSGSVTEDAGNTLMTSGTLSIADVDGGEASFTPETITGTYGSLTIDGSGSWSYSASNNHADIQVLGNGDTLTETLTVRTLDGTTRNIVITINGTNDAAVITGDDSGSVTEDAGNTLMTSGTLSIADVDGGEASFTPETITGTYGSLTIDGSGSWSYSASNNHADIQVLGNGDTLTETLTVRTLDGTTRNIVITINGTNDAAVITGDDSGSVTEDASNTLMTSGTLNITDVDGGEASFTPETITGTYGSLTIDGSGTWSYSASNNHADIQALGNGDTLTETLTVRTLDGTTRNIVITINGTNDVAVITGDDSGSVTEDAGNTLMTSGTLSIADVDGGEASFTPETITGTYGSLTIDGSGSWSYSASNNHADIQALGNGDTLTETLTVRTLDGTTRNIVITINGTNDAAVITGDDSGSVTEDVGNTLMTSGTLNITDVDGGEASFTPETITGTYGSLTIDGSGSWSYSASNNHADIQALGNGDSLSETLTVQSLDGTTHNIVITINGANDGPAIDAGTPDQSATEEQVFSYQVPANAFSDIDGDNLTYSATLDDGSPLPAWLSFDPSNGTFSGTPDDPDLGQITIKVTASDGILSVSDQFKINVAGVNDAPELVGTLNNQMVAEESAFSYTIPANAFSDAEGDTLTYSASLADDDPLPAWLTFDAGTRTFSGTPDDPDVGNLSVKISVSDGSETTDVFWSMNVTAVNDAPELSGSPLISGVEAAYSFSDNTDISGNGNNLTLSGSATLGSGHNGGQAFEMNGSSGGGEISGLKIGGALTISAWVKYDSLNQNWSRIIDFANGPADNNILLAHIGTSNDLAFEIYDGAGYPADGQLHISNFFTEGEWVHLTATIDNTGAMRIYKNGELAGENLNGAVLPEIVRSGNYVGKSHWGHDGDLDGSIDDFAVFNSALSAHQVKAVYEADSVENLISDAFHVIEQSPNSTVLGSVAATDIDNASNQLTYTLSNDAGGRFTINSSTGEISVADSTLLDHDSNASHTITVQVSDGQLSSTRDYTVFVNSSTLSTYEDTSYALTLTDLSHSDQEAAAMTQIKLSTLPDEGTLKLNGVAVTQDQVISKADIEAGLLVFEPDSNEADDNYTSIGFKVHDGNSYSGEYTRTFDVAAVADSVTMNNIGSEVLNSTFDGNNTDGWQRTNPYGISHSMVKNNRLNNYYSTESYRNIDTSDSSVQTYELTFILHHERNLHHTTNIRVKWNGQTVATYTEAPGSGTHTSTKTILLNATGNPSTELRFDEDINVFYLDNIRITKVRATDEDTAFNLPDLGITQVDSDGSETLTVSADGVPAGAVLTDGSHSITADGTAVDISGWDFANLQITPPADSTDTMNLTFTATTTESNGDSSSVSESLSIRVNSVDDKPVSSDNSLLLKQTDSYTFSTEDFSFTDGDAGDSLQSITITSLPASGALTLNGAAVTANQVITAADLGNLTYTAPATDPDVGTSFGFTVSDGILSSDPQTFSLNVRGTYSQNLLTNGSAENGTSGWNIIANGGDGWGSGNSSHDGDGQSWVTSNAWAKKSQTVDLLAKGFTEQYLDSAPDISVSDWFKDNGANDDYYLKVELRDASNNVIASYDTGTLTATDNWQEAANTFSNYGAGVRYVYFEHGAKDQENLSGHHGASIDDSEVVLKIGDVDLVGTNSGEIIDGTVQSDTLRGEGGADTLLGDAGDDLIFGGASKDIITGGAGDDILSGDDDSDTFVWLASDLGSAANPAEDVIKDFNTGSGGDVIDLSDVLVDNSTPLDQYLSLNFDNGDTTIEVMPDADGDITQKIKLEGVDLSGYGGGSTDAQILNNLISDGNLQID